MTRSDPVLAIEVVVATAFAGAYGVAALIMGLRHRRGDLRIGMPVAVGACVRVVAVLGVSATAGARELRGEDELLFLGRAMELSSGGHSPRGWVETFASALHEGIFASQLAIAAAPDLALRVTQIAIAMAGTVLVVVAVYDLAGARASSLAAWLLALEPTAVFFSGLLHEESNMLLAIGLVTFGGAKLWAGERLCSLLPIAAGATIALTTRPYAGWFLVLAGAAIAVASSLRHARRRPAGAVLMLLAMGTALLIALPSMLSATSDQSLRSNLQSSQDALTREGGGNLRFEPIDFSSRTAIVTNLPRRIRDVLFRPYPWQLSNDSQRLGAVGAVIFLAMLTTLAIMSLQLGWRTLTEAAPFLIPGGCLLIAYALSSGNAGQAFRHRTVLVALGIGILVVLREARLTGKNRPGIAKNQLRSPAVDFAQPPGVLGARH